MLLRHSCTCMAQVQEASVRFADHLSSRSGQSVSLWTAVSQAPTSASGDKGLTASSSLQVKTRSPSAARHHQLVATGRSASAPLPAARLSPPVPSIPGQGLFQEALLERLPLPADRGAASLPGDISRGRRSSMPQPKTRPDSPVPSLQGPCDQSLKSEVPCGSCRAKRAAALPPSAR